MSATPEAKAKKEIKAYLDTLEYCFYWMPVSGGFGNSAVDIVGCYCARFFCIEVKPRAGMKATPRQNKFMNDVKAAYGFAAVITSVAELIEFIAYIDADIEKSRGG